MAHSQTTEADLLVQVLEQQNSLLESDSRAILNISSIVSIAATKTVVKGSVEARVVQWSEIILNWDLYKKKPARLLTFVYNGIPDPLRGMIWYNKLIYLLYNQCDFCK